jgi:peptidyl-prolyl cis-trans isomerase B (cyclophilin B)
MKQRELKFRHSPSGWNLNQEERTRDQMKRILLVMIFFVFLLSLSTSESFSQEVRYRKFSSEEVKKMSEQQAIIRTNLGDITLKFFPEVAPNHVNNFIELAKKGFYNGTTFHRVVPRFVIQGGDPNSKNLDRSKHGMGGPGYQVKAEFNKKPHRRGTLSMARSAHPDSAGSQFFICVADVPSLDGQYTVFGEVVKGIEVVDKIVSQTRDGNDNPKDRIEMTVDIVTQ